MDAKKLICFDMDNTISNSDKVHSTAFNYALEKLGYKTKKSKEIYTLLGMPKEELAKILLEDNSKIKANKLLKLHDYYLIKKSYRYAKPIKGVKKVLKKLKKKYRLAIVSNCKHNNIVYILKGSKIDKKLFDILIGNDDVKRSKPYPDEILKAEKLTKHDAEYMIGDSTYDVIAGKRAKVKTIVVLSASHYPRKELLKQKPFLIVKNIRELPRILL